MDKPQKNESEQFDFFARCYTQFAVATQRMGEIRHYFELSGKSVCLVFAGDKMVSVITTALEHLRIHKTHQPELTICIWDSESTSVEIPDAPCDPYCFTHRGDIKGFNSPNIKTAYKWTENSVSVMDLYTNTAVFWIKSYKALPFSVITAPLHTLFNWWLEKQDCLLIPASVVGTDEDALLIPGINTTGFDFNKLPELRTGNKLKCIELNYFIVQLKPFPSLVNLFKSPGVDNRKKVLFQDSIKLKAIFSIELHSDTSMAIEPVSQLNALRKISFDIMTQMPGSGWHTHHLIRKLLQKVPSYKLKSGTDMGQIHKIFSEFLINPDKYSHFSRKESQSPKPMISLIIPVYNGERFIREAIENVISQNYPVLEIIIVDDGSTDQTEAIIGLLNKNIRYIKQENEGPASARNHGLKEANGQYVVFLDADDLFPEGNFNVLIKEMLQHPELEVVHGYAQLLQEDPVSRKFELIGNPKESYPYYISAGLYRKSVFDKVGLFDSSLQFSEDTDWFFRAIGMNCNIKRIEEITLYVRRHENNMTKGKDLIELKLLHVIKRKIDRKRSD